MRIQLRWSCFLLLAITLLVCKQTSAATLTGKVIEINDGDEITIFNLNRPVRIRLIGIDAPEKEQAFGVTAKQHLSDLIYDKVVFVEYSGIGRDSSLIGRVILNDVDISAQMIRDGVAWFDTNYTGQMSNTQREIYLQSEKAARQERRGLWQTEGVVPPWEFVKARQQGTVVASSSPSFSPTQFPKSDRQIPELTNLNLLQTGTSGARPLTALAFDPSDMSWVTEGSFRKTWRRLQPNTENFTVLIPEGKSGVMSIPLGSEMLDVNYYLARDGHSFYAMFWLSGPHLVETDSVILDGALNSFLSGVGEGFEKAGNGNFHCEATSQRKLLINGYAGRDIDLSDCAVPGAARIFTKATADRRQIYGGFVFFREPDENVSKFLKSFTVLGRKSEGQITKAHQ